MLLVYSDDFTHVLLPEVVVVGHWGGELDIVDVVPQLREQLARQVDHAVAEGGLEKVKIYLSMDNFLRSIN